jgi:hypothetical protein
LLDDISNYQEDWGTIEMNGKYLESIEGAVVMTEQNLRSFVTDRNSRFSWATFLPKRRAWIQTLILFPFGLPVGNFLGASWNFSVNLMMEEHQYLTSVLLMGFNLLLPSLFFAFLFHWGWFAWKREGQAWYPQAEGLLAGLYAALTIAISFSVVKIFTQNLGVCGSPGWGEIGQSLLCNLDNYGFESKSWFGAWFIVAAYCYQAQGKIHRSFARIFRLRQASPQSSQVDLIEEAESIRSTSETIPPNGES